MRIAPTGGCNMKNGRICAVCECTYMWSGAMPVSRVSAAQRDASGRRDAKAKSSRISGAQSHRRMVITTAAGPHGHDEA